MTKGASRIVVSDVDLDIVAAMVRACPGVDDLDGGPLNARLATYLPGRKIEGLRLTDDVLTVQIRSIWGVPITEVVAQIRLALASLTGGRRLDIIVADLTPAPGYEPQSELEPEVEPEGAPAWLTDPLLGPTTPSTDARDASTSAPTTPTQVEIPQISLLASPISKADPPPEYSS